MTTLESHYEALATLHRSAIDAHDSRLSALESSPATPTRHVPIYASFDYADTQPIEFPVWTERVYLMRQAMVCERIGEGEFNWTSIDSERVAKSLRVKMAVPPYTRNIVCADYEQKNMTNEQWFRGMLDLMEILHENDVQNVGLYFPFRAHSILGIRAVTDLCHCLLVPTGYIRSDELNTKGESVIRKHTESALQFNRPVIAVNSMWETASGDETTPKQERPIEMVAEMSVIAVDAGAHAPMVWGDNQSPDRYAAALLAVKGAVG